MKVIILPLPVIRLLTLFAGDATAISTRFGVLTSKGHAYDEVMLSHEGIHHHQRIEVGANKFLLIYLSDWLKGLVKYRSLKKAYKQIRFEQEAFSNQFKQYYLLERKPFAWQQYEV